MLYGEGETRHGDTTASPDMTRVYLFQTNKLTDPVGDPGGGGGGPCPPPRGLKNFFAIINIITKPTAYDGPWEY